MSDILDVLDGEPIELENEVPEQAETPQAPVEQEEPQVEATAETADEATPKLKWQIPSGWREVPSPPR